MTSAPTKTAICKNWMKSTCWFGDRCGFAHGESEIGMLRPGNVEMKKRDRGTEEAAEELARSEFIACAPPEAFSRYMYINI